MWPTPQSSHIYIDIREPINKLWPHVPFLKNLDINQCPSNELVVYLMYII